MFGEVFFSLNRIPALGAMNRHQQKFVSSVSSTGELSESQMAIVDIAIPHNKVRAQHSIAG